MSTIINKETQSPVQDWATDFVQKEKSRNDISNFGRPYFYDQLSIFDSNDSFCTNKEKCRNKNQVQMERNLIHGK
jgi:hypothetical protein